MSLTGSMRSLVGRLRRYLARPVVDPTVTANGRSPAGGEALAGHRVMVTGAGRNVGRAVAIEMAAEGAEVYLADIEVSRAEEVAAQLGASAERALQCDVSDLSSVDRLWGELGQRRVTIDTLVHCAVYQSGPRRFLESDPLDWRRTFDTNVLGPAHLTRLMAQRLAEQQRSGSIVFLSSVHRWITGGWADYSASKSALDMMVRELALDLAPRGIRVNAIAPGWVADADEPSAGFFPHAPLGRRAIPPEYIGRAAKFLASPHDSAFTTGTVLTIDAGVSLRSYRTPGAAALGDPHVRKDADAAP